MTFNESFEVLCDLSLDSGRALIKYEDDFRDYWKEVVQQLCLNYYGGRYKSPEPFLIGFDDEFKFIESYASDWFFEGLGK